MALSRAVLGGPLLSSGRADSEQSITVPCLRLYQSSLQVSEGGGGQANRTLDTRGEMGESLEREGRLGGVLRAAC